MRIPARAFLGIVPLAVVGLTAGFGYFLKNRKQMLMDLGPSRIELPPFAKYKLEETGTGDPSGKLSDELRKSYNGSLAWWVRLQLSAPGRYRAPSFEAIDSDHRPWPLYTARDHDHLLLGIPEGYSQSPASLIIRQRGELSSTPIPVKLPAAKQFLTKASHQEDWPGLSLYVAQSQIDTRVVGEYRLPNGYLVHMHPLRTQFARQCGYFRPWYTGMFREGVDMIAPRFLLIPYPQESTLVELQIARERPVRTKQRITITGAKVLRHRAGFVLDLPSQVDGFRLSNLRVQADNRPFTIGIDYVANARREQFDGPEMLPSRPRVATAKLIGPKLPIGLLFEGVTGPVGEAALIKSDVKEGPLPPFTIEIGIDVYEVEKSGRVVIPVKRSAGRGNLVLNYPPHDKIESRSAEGEMRGGRGGPARMPMRAMAAD